MAEVFTAFIGAATQLDIAIYDFRLLDGPLTDQIVTLVRPDCLRWCTRSVRGMESRDPEGTDPACR